MYQRCAYNEYFLNMPNPNRADEDRGSGLLLKWDVEMVGLKFIETYIIIHHHTSYNSLIDAMAKYKVFLRSISCQDLDD